MLKKISLIILLSFSMVLASCVTAHKKTVALKGEGISLEEKWGIRAEALRLSAAGYMLDFRYRVLDPQKAAGLFDRKTKPYLIDQKSGAKFLVPSPPKVGPLRTSDSPKRDKIYFILFANPGQYIKQGNPVTIVIGDFKAENLIVQ